MLECTILKLSIVHYARGTEHKRGIMSKNIPPPWCKNLLVSNVMPKTTPCIVYHACLQGQGVLGYGDRVGGQWFGWLVTLGYPKRDRVINTMFCKMNVLVFHMVQCFPTHGQWLHVPWLTLVMVLIMDVVSSMACHENSHPGSLLILEAHYHLCNIEL